jgi:hypothetical protein
VSNTESQLQRSILPIRSTLKLNEGPFRVVFFLLSSVFNAGTEFEYILHCVPVTLRITILSIWIQY